MSKSEGQVLDFEKICRLCLLEKRSMSAIFSKKKSDKKVPLPVRIMSCASLELYEGDGLPASICSKCLLSVNQSYAFREQCEQADTTLRQYAQRMNEASEETSTNRESGECVANDSPERIEDIGINVEEGCDGGDQDLERGDNLESKVNPNKCFSFNFGKVAISSVKNSANNLGEMDDLVWRGAKKKRRTKSAECEGNPDAIDGNVDEHQESAVKERLDCDKMDVEESETKAEPFDCTVLKALSAEKAENVVVIADVETINAKFPLEDEDCDFGETASEDDDSITKTRGRKWYHQGVIGKKELQLLQSYKLDRRKSSNTKSSKKSNSEKQKNTRLLQNLMKNKNIIVQKRASCSSVDYLTGKTSPVRNSEFVKSLHRKRNISFPYDFKIAQLWKEWEEVNKRIPQMKKKRSMEAISKPNKVTPHLTSSNLQEEDLLSRNEESSAEMVAEETVEDNKTKWKNGKDTVYCKDCRIFLLRSSYNNHIKFVHEKIRKYLCQTCGYAACTGTILRQHVQAVHVGYSFFCDQCPKKFNLMKRLRKHVELQHSGKPIERNHICQYCGMAFVKPGCLKRHLRSHTQETPYQCQYCQRRFKYRWPKVQHERLHTGEKPYKCSFCDERFTQNCVRKAHEYKKHGNEEFKPKTRLKKEEDQLKTEREDSEGSSTGSPHSCSESS